ncbi:MAG: hypothetical protein HYV63_33105 [Candidatus Schekmanbacteria bacterium]|nr:hypothetical protein [Candidatus Schekmanbacteria bacterium]
MRRPRRPWRVRHVASPVRLSALLAAASLVVFVAAAARGLNLWDEGIVPAGAERMLNGQWPQRDFFAYAPGRYLLGLAALRLAGGSLMGPRLLGAVLGAAVVAFTVFATTLLARPGRARAAACALASAVIVAAPGYYFQRDLALGALMVVAASAARQYAIWLSTALIGVALLRNELFPVAVAAVLAAEFLAARRIPSASRLAACGGAVLCGTSVFAALNFISRGGRASGGTAQSVTEKLWDMFWKAGADWGLPLLSTVPDRFAALRWLPVRLAEPAIVGAAFLSTLGVALVALIAWCGQGTAARSWSLRPGSPRGCRSAILLALVGGYALPMLWWRSGFGNVARALPPYLALWAALVCRASRGPWRRQAVDLGPAGALNRARFAFLRTGSGRRVTAWAIYAYLCAGFATAALVIFPEPCGSPWYGVGDDWVDLSHPKAPIRVSRFYQTVVSSVLQLIEEQVPRGQPLVGLPMQPIWNFLANRPSPLPIDFLLPPEAGLPGGQQRLTADLARASNPPIVLGMVAIDDIPSRRFDRYAPLVAAYLAEHYRTAGRVDRFWLLLPRPPAPDRSRLWNELAAAAGRLPGFATVSVDEEGWKERGVLAPLEGELEIGIPAPMSAENRGREVAATRASGEPHAVMLRTLCLRTVVALVASSGGAAPRPCPGSVTATLRLLPDDIERDGGPTATTRRELRLEFPRLEREVVLATTIPAEATTARAALTWRAASDGAESPVGVRFREPVWETCPALR